MSISILKPSETGVAEAIEPRSKVAKPVPVLSNDVLRGVKVSLEVRLGNTSMTVEEMMALKPGSVVTLGAGLADHVGLYLNGTLIAHGEVVAVGDKYGVRIMDIVPAQP